MFISKNLIPEYPRPQMTRNEWMNLNGVWEFQRSADLNEKPPFGKKLTENILVPFPRRKHPFRNHGTTGQILVQTYI